MFPITRNGQTSFPGNTDFLGSTFEEKVPGVTEHDFGIFGATDTATGRVMWRNRVPQPAKSCLLVAGDLVFFGEGNGRFHAVDATTGATLWTFQGQGVPKSGGAQAAPVAYVTGGREYMVNAFGGNKADRDSFPPNPVGDAIVDLRFHLARNSRGRRPGRTRKCDEVKRCLQRWRKRTSCGNNRADTVRRFHSGGYSIGSASIEMRQEREPRDSSSRSNIRVNRGEFHNRN